jgi:hypothetical protein
MSIYNVQVTESCLKSFEFRAVPTKNGGTMYTATQDCYIEKYNEGDEFPTRTNVDVEVPEGQTTAPAPYPVGKYTLEVVMGHDRYGKPDTEDYQKFYLKPQASSK